MGKASPAHGHLPRCGAKTVICGEVRDVSMLIWNSPILQVPELLGTTENELGIRKWLEDQGHTLITTSDKEGENSTFDKELVDAEIIITTP